MKTKGIGWGKLYVAGEYAVVDPGHPAIIMATQRCIRATIEPSNQYKLINKNNKREISFDDLTVVDTYWKYALSALQVFYQWLEEQGIDHSYVKISIKSDLDSEDGRKLGLGSSGAVVAAIIKGLTRYYRLNIDAYSQYKLCVVSQSRLQIGGSYGDLAAAIFGGVIRYTRFEHFDMNKSLSDLLVMEWPKMSITYLELPTDLHWVVGWTGIPASTQNQVEKINAFKDEPMYSQLLWKAAQIVDDMTKCHTALEFMEGIHRYRQWLNDLESLTHLTIETPMIQSFIELCDKYQGIGKSSGAGGGDCAIAFFPHKVNINDILLSEGIMPLTISIAKREII
jgi:phosphomevalonate kinase